MNRASLPAHTHAPQTLVAPAKLNLWLRLTQARRPDGRHELRSHFAPLALGDHLTLRPTRAFSLSVQGPFAHGVPEDDRNLLAQAFAGFCRTFAPVPPLQIDLEKNIPHGAGLGGGSSDAGALLAYLARQTGCNVDEVRDWSLSLGADVPAALGPHSGLVAGVGEILGARLPVPEKRVLLVKPARSCPTREVFATLPALGPALEASENDLESAASRVCPEIAEILAYLRTHIDPRAQMTGSGSTCFALVSNAFSLTHEHRKALDRFWVHLTDFAVVAVP